MRKNKKDDFEDDGRQIADMSDTYLSMFGTHFRRDIARKKPAKRKREDEKDKDMEFENFELTKEERRGLALNAFLAALAVGFVFIAVMFAFFWFAVNIWLK